LYLTLAELFAGPPEWLATPVHEWPLIQELTQLAPSSRTAQRAIPAFSKIMPTSILQRQMQYASLFLPAVKPHYWLYESAAKTGRILGPQTWELVKLYRAAGLPLAFRAELADHASLELGFLSYLAEFIEVDPEHAIDWRNLELQFIQSHGDWLIQLGLNLADSHDEIYAPLGAFLAGWLNELLYQTEENIVIKVEPTVFQLPMVGIADQCTLCGFCIPACQSHALRMCENHKETSLILKASACNGCGDCQRACEYYAIYMENYPIGDDAWNRDIVLRQSPRASCPACGQPTVSRAEMDYLKARLGSPTWLEFCTDCRSKY